MRTRLHSLLALSITLVILISSCKEKERVAARPGLYPIKERSRYGYMNEEGKVVIPPSFDFAWDFQDGMARFKEKGKYGFINEKGEIVIKPEFAYADDFKDGFARINISDTIVHDVQYDGYDLNSGWTFIDKKGVVFSHNFAKAEYLKNGFAQVKDDPSYDAPWNYAVLANGSLIREERNTEAIFSFNGHDLAPASHPESGKIGAINKNEEWVIPASFDAIEPFSEGLAAAKRDNLYGYIDLNGAWIYQQVVSINQSFDLPTDFRPFSNGMALVKLATDQYIFVGKDGKPAFQKKFNSASPFTSEGYAIAADDKGTGLIDMTGNFIIKPNLDIVLVQNGIVIFRNNLSFGAKDLKTQKELVPAVYDEVQITGDFIRIKNRGATYGYIGRSGEFVISPHYDMAWSFSNGKAIVEQKGKYVYVDKSGKVLGDVPEKDQPYYYKPSSSLYASLDNSKFGFSSTEKIGLVIPAQYDFASDFEGKIARVNLGAALNEDNYEYRGGKWGLINESGKELTPMTYDLIMPFHNNIAMFNIGGDAGYTPCEGECDQGVYYNCTGGKWGLIEQSGKIILEAKYQSIIPFGENFLVAEDTTYSLVSGQGNILYPGQLSVPVTGEEGILTRYEARFLNISEDGKMGIMDVNGKWILQPTFDEVRINSEETPFNEGLVIIRKDASWGMVDASGTSVIPAEYEEIHDFSHGLAATKRNGRWGFINKNNEVVIDHQYYSVHDFQGDVAIVEPEPNAGEGVINNHGEMIFSPSAGITFDYRGFIHGLCVINGSAQNDEAGYPVSTSGVINSRGKIIFHQNALTEARIQPFGILYVIKDNKWAIATHDGAMLTGYDYNWIEPYSGQELIRCNVGGSIAYGEYGEEEEAYGGRWGFVDKTGKLRIACNYSELGAFQDGLAPARTAEDLDEIGYVDMDGKIVRPLTK